MGVRRLAVANGPNIFQMLLVFSLLTHDCLCRVQYHAIVTDLEEYNLKFHAFISPPKYCNEPVWVYVPVCLCLSISLHISKNTRPNFTKFYTLLHVDVL